jgi:hypothetical protein
MDATVNYHVALDASRREEEAFCDIKSALDKIAEAGDDILDQWIVIGERLIELKGPREKFDGTFNDKCKSRGIFLTSKERSTAQWWAALAPEQRETLRAEFPKRLEPETLQGGCREKHPNWATTRKSKAFESFESVRKRRPKPKTPAVEQTEDEPEVTLRAADRKRIKAEEEERYREELRKERAEIRSARQEKLARINSTGCLQPLPNVTIVMYGRKLWPVSDEERLEVGYYDYDQLAFAIKQFTAWSKFIPNNVRAESLANHMRVRIDGLAGYVKHCLPAGDCREKMEGFVAVFQKLADFYEANPDGECRPPHHGNIPT